MITKYFNFLLPTRTCRARQPLSERTRTVYHGLPANYLRASTDPGRYLAFLGRLTAEKGPEDAIRIAKAVGMQLRIAAKIPRGERRYFTERLHPLIDRERQRIRRRRGLRRAAHRLTASARLDHADPGNRRRARAHHARTRRIRDQPARRVAHRRRARAGDRVVRHLRNGHRGPSALRSRSVDRLGMSGRGVEARGLASPDGQAGHPDPDCSS